MGRYNAYEYYLLYMEGIPYNISWVASILILSILSSLLMGMSLYRLGMDKITIQALHAVHNELLFVNLYNYTMLYTHTYRAITPI